MPDDRLPAAPTPEMISAGVEALSQVAWDMTSYAEIAEKVFAAMIAKAPPSSDPLGQRIRFAPYAPDVATRDYVAHLGAHTHGFVMPDGSFGAGGLTLIPVR